MVNAIQPKKLLIVNIIDILNRYTDENHTLTQRDIENILESEYMMKVDRKAIHRNLVDLIECDIFELQYTEKTRMAKEMRKNKKTGRMEPTGKTYPSPVYTDFSIVREFTEGELRYLIDGVFASSHIPAKHRVQLIRKLENLGGSYFKSHAGHIAREAPLAIYSKEVLANIALLDEAIQKKRKVMFHYRIFGADKKSSYRMDGEGRPREYVINPYEMVFKDGQYYLICNNDKFDNLSNYRVDRIADVTLLDEKARPLKSLDDDVNLGRYMREHIYMWVGDAVNCELLMPQNMVDILMDTFGGYFHIKKLNDDDTMNVVVKVNEDNIVKFAKAYCPFAKVIKPRRIVNRLKREFAEALKEYE